MSTTKNVNVTTGKVLHYTISKEGYKTVNGSKLITADTTLNINMIPSTSSDGAYTFGDRIGGIATFFGYFDSVNPGTGDTQKYACFVLDAQYRDAKSLSSGDVSSYLPTYQIGSTPDVALASKESSTYNNDAIFFNVSPSSSFAQAFYYARNPGGQSLIINVDGVNYQPLLPNVNELNQIYTYRTQLDAIDPTLSSYSSKGLTSWSFGSTQVPNGAWSSTYGGAFNAGGYTYYAWWCVTYTGDVAATSSDGTQTLGVVPVFEIPVS